MQFQKRSILPHRRDWNFLGDGGSVRPKYSKKYMKLNWNYQRGGGGGLEKISSMGRYGNFLELQIIDGGISFRTHIKRMIF